METVKEQIKQIFVAHENYPPHYAFWGAAPKVGDQIDGRTVVSIHELPFNTEQILIVIR